MALQIKLCHFRVWIKDQYDNPISNATVDLDWLPSDTFVSDYGLITNVNGYAERAVSSGLYNIRVRHPNFETYYEYGIYFPECQTWPYTTYFDRIIHLKSTITPPPTGKQITFYLVDNKFHRVRRGHVTLQGQPQSVTDWDGKVVYLNIASGTYNVVFGGQTADFVDFNFTSTITMPNADIIYTVWVIDQTIIQGLPPTDPDPPPVFPGWSWEEIFDWLQINWPVALAGGIILIVGISILTAPKAPQIIIVGREEKR